MTLAERKVVFEKERSDTENTLLCFKGKAIEGFDVYNCSAPFIWQGRRYIYGRVERRNEWTRSWTRLFEETNNDEFTLVPDSITYQLEDPFVTRIGDELVMGGTHVKYSCNRFVTVYGYFYRGTDLEDLRYFTTGPNDMKDIRLVDLGANGVGVFSRPLNKEIEERYGSTSVIGFTVIPGLDNLDENVVSAARVIPGLFSEGEWGGCNQCHLLDSGYIGVIGHKSYQDSNDDGQTLNVYINIAFVFDLVNNRVIDEKILATRSSYPVTPAKRADLRDCTFTSGIVPRADGKFDLYGGLGDVAEGRVVIDDPFAGYGSIVADKRFL
ncbi:MAG: DUF1861 family protein [Treponema sp.]|jgi:hypothetical protein|nr:DUF1861 family protein [Treponema sp.]